MKSFAILVVGSGENTRLVDLVFDVGFVAVCRTTLAGAIEALRHQRFGAVVFDASHTDIDPAEFVLNAREFDADVPVVVLGRGDGADAELLGRLPHTHVVDAPTTSAALSAALFRAVVPRPGGTENWTRGGQDASSRL